jgi:hypothetical protein
VLCLQLLEPRDRLDATDRRPEDPGERPLAVVGELALERREPELGALLGDDAGGRALA